MPLKLSRQILAAARVCKQTLGSRASIPRVRMRKMPGKSPILIRFLLEDAALANRWRAALSRDGAFQLQPDESVDDARQQRPGGPPHVLVVDEFAMLDPADQRRVCRGATGVICASGANATSHETQLAQLDRPLDTARQARAASRILLPADVTDREIVLACRLLGENARLRRRLRRDHRQRRRLAKLADTDPLTGLLNRRAWQRELRSRVRERASGSVGHCLVVVDIDHLKRASTRLTVIRQGIKFSSSPPTHCGAACEGAIP